MTNIQVAIAVVMCARLVISAMLAAFRITWRDGDVKENLTQIMGVEKELDELCDKLFEQREMEKHGRRS